MTIVFRCDPRIDHILPRPVPARRGLPVWLRSMPMAAFSDPQGTDVRTVKQCPPFVDAMSAGFLMPLACDVEVTDAGFRWDWTDIPDDTPSHVYRSPLSFHLAEQLTGSPVFEPDSLAVKFVNHWLIETEPGCSLLITHPVNRLDLPFRSLTGLVNTDLYHDNYTHFPALWTDRAFRGTLPKGTPVAQCIPVQRQAQELHFETLDPEGDEEVAAVQKALRAEPGYYKRTARP